MSVRKVPAPLWGKP